MKVYLSISMTVNSSRRNLIRDILIRKGFEVKYWDKSTGYSTRDLDSCDVLVVVPYNRPEESPWTESTSRTDYGTYVSRGQYTEIQFALERGKRCMVYHDIEVGRPSDIGISYIPPEEVLLVVNQQDWKGRYGKVMSYVTGIRPIPFTDFMMRPMDCETCEIPWEGTAQVLDRRLLLLLL